MQRVDRLGERRDAGLSGSRQRVRRVASRAQDRLLVVVRRREEAVAAIAGGDEQRRVVRVVRVVLVVGAQDVEAEVALRIGIVHPAAVRPGRTGRARRVAAGAGHLVGHRQHDVGLRERGAGRGVADDDAHQRIGVLAAASS